MSEVNNDPFEGFELYPTKNEPDPFEGFELYPESENAPEIETIKAAKAQRPNADDFAKSLGLSEKYGVDVSMIEGSEKDFNDDQEIKNWSPLLKYNKTFFSDPVNASLAHDDLDGIKKINKDTEDVGFFMGLMREVSSGGLKAISGLIKSAAIQNDAYGMTDNTGEFHANPEFEGLGLEEYNKVTQERAYKQAKDILNNPISKSLDDVAEKLSTPQSKRNMLEDLKSGDVGEVLKSGVYLVAQNAPQLALMMAAPTVGLSQMLLSTYGNKLGENVEAAENGNNAIFAASNLNALGNAGIEVSIERLTGVGSKMFKDSAKAMSGAVTELVSEVGEKTTLDVLKKSFIYLGKQSLGEGAEEVATTLAQNTLDVAMGINENAFDDIGDQLLKSFIGGAGGGKLAGSVQVAANLSTDLSFRKNIQAQTNQFYAKFGETVKESKLFKRNKKAAEALIQENIESTNPDLKKVFIEPEAFEEYFQGKGKTAGEAAAELGLTAELEQASATGGKIEVPFGKWVTATADTEHYQGLAREITFDPEIETIGARERQEAELKALAEAQAKEAEMQDEPFVDPKDVTENTFSKIFKNQAQAQAFIAAQESIINSTSESEANAFIQSKIDLVKKKMPELKRKKKSAKQIEKEINIEYNQVLKNFEAKLIQAGRTPQAAKTEATLIASRARARKSYFPNRSILDLASELTDIRSTQWQGEGSVLNSRTTSLQENPLFASQALTVPRDEAGAIVYEPMVLESLRASIARGEAGQRVNKINENGEVTGTLAQESSFPEFFKNKGYKKADALKAIDKQIAGEALTDNQKAMLEDLYAGAYEATARQEYFQFAGQRSQTAVIKNLEEANTRAIAGEDMEQIRKDTGWFKGPDNRWRYEISDAEAKFKPIDINKKKKYKLSEVLDHKELFAAYPQLNDIKVEFAAHRGRKGGHFDRTTNTIKVMVETLKEYPASYDDAVATIKRLKESDKYKQYLADYAVRNESGINKWRQSEAFKEMFQASIVVQSIKPKTSFPKDLNAKHNAAAMQVILHEIQHSIQAVEGFARGSNPKAAMGYRNYFNTLGEIEARNVEARRNLNPEQLTETTPDIQTWKNPIINWGSVTEELPINSPQQLADLSKAKQMSFFQGARNRAIFNRENLPLDIEIPEAHVPAVDIDDKEVEFNYRLNNAEQIYYAVRNNKVVGHLGLDSDNTVISVHIDADYQRQGLATELYIQAVKENGDINSDDPSAMEPEAKSLWNRLAKEYPEFVTRNGEGRYSFTTGQVFYQGANYGEFKVTPNMPKTVSVLILNESEMSKSKYASLKAAKDYASDNLRNQSVRNEMTGMDIDLPQGGFNKVGVGRSNIQNIAALVNIDKLIKIAIYEGAESVGKDKPDISRYHRFYASMNLAGDDYIIRIKVSEGRDGVKFYHEIGVDNKTLRSRSKPANPSIFADQAVTEGDDIDGNLSGQDIALGLPQSNVARSTISIDEFAANINAARKNYNWFQNAQAPKGRTLISNNGQKVIELFETADASTLVHELGHVFLDDMITDAFATGDYLLASDLNKFFKVQGFDFKIQDGEAIIRQAINDPEIGVKLHEAFAESFEIYLREGKAPDANLKGVFRRFGAWLRRIYQDLRAFGGLRINEDTRLMFDAMLSAEAYESRAAELLYMNTPLLAELESMPKEMQDRYIAASEDAKATVQEKLVAEYIKREQKRQDKERAKAFKEMFERELENLKKFDPVYRAADLMSGRRFKDDNGEWVTNSVGKIDLNYAKTLIGAELSATLKKATSGNQDQVLDADQLAEALGFRNGDELIRALHHAQNIEDVARENAMATFKEQFGTEKSSDELLAEAEEAYHAGDLTNVYKLELEQLMADNPKLARETIKILGRNKATWSDAIKKAAKTQIDKMKMSEAGSYKFARSEAKHNRLAHDAFAKGDLHVALVHKYNAFLNHALYVEAKEIEKQKERVQKVFKKLNQADTILAKNREMNLVQGARALVTYLTEGKRGDFETPLLKFGEVSPTDAAMAQGLIENMKIPFSSGSELNTREWLEVADSIESLWDMAKEIQEIRMGEEKAKVAEIVDDISNELAESNDSYESWGVNEKMTSAQEREFKVLSVVAFQSRVEHWARSVGEKTKAFLVDRLYEAQNRYNAEKITQFTKLGEMFEKNKHLFTNDPIEMTGLNYKFENMSELLSAMLHTGTQSSKERLLVGRNWHSEGGQYDSRWNAEIAKLERDGVLTKEHYQFLQDVWNHFESMKPALYKDHFERTGVKPKELTALPLQTSFGEFKGGYFKATYDSKLSFSAQKSEASEKVEAAQLKATVNQSVTKSRASSVTDVMELDLRQVFKNTDGILKIIYLEKTLRETDRVLRNYDLMTSLKNYNPAIMKNMLEPMLKRFAAQTTSRSSENEGDRFLSKLLTGAQGFTSRAVMMFNIPNFFQNFTGAIPSLVEISPAKLAGSLRRSITNPTESTEFILSKSEYMRTTSENDLKKVLKAYKRIIKESDAQKEFKDAAIEFGYITEGISNGIVSRAIWLAKYEGSLIDGLSEEQAIIEADSAVRRFGAVKDPIGIQGSDATTALEKALNMFSSYFNNSINLQYYGQKGLSKIDDKFERYKARMKLYAFGLMIPAVISELIVRAFSPDDLMDGDDEWGYADDIFKIMMLSQLRWVLAGTNQLIGRIGAFVLDTIEGDRPMTTFNATPVNMVFNIAKDTGKAIAKLSDEGELDHRGAKAFGQLLQGVTGIPVTIITKPMSYVLKENPTEISAETVRGLVTGR